MKDNSFSMAMNKIVGEHEAELQREVRSQKRRVLMGRLRKGFTFIAIAGVLAAAFIYRGKLQTTIKSKFFHSDTTTAQASANPVGQASSSLNGARQNAATRDALINDLSQSK